MHYVKSSSFVKVKEHNMKHATSEGRSTINKKNRNSKQNTLAHLPVNLHVVGQHGMAGELSLALLTHKIWLLAVLNLANALAVVLIVWLQLGL